MSLPVISACLYLDISHFGLRLIRNNPEMPVHIIDARYVSTKKLIAFLRQRFPQVQAESEFKLEVRFRPRGSHEGK